MTAPAARTAYDPFAPAAGYAFPERRLRRAGLDDAAVSRLAEEYERLDAQERRELSRFVTRSPDSRIRARFQGTRTRAELEALRVDDLLPLLRERRLSTEGRKADFVARLLASYEGGTQEQPTRAPQEAATPQEPAAPSGDTPDSPQPVTGEDSGPAAPQEDPASAPEAVTGVVTPPQTPDATPAPDAAPAADTHTEE